MRRTLALAALLLATVARPAGAWWTWFEAERPFATNMSGRFAYAPLNDAERAKLSGAAWIGGDKKRTAPLFAVYDVDVPAAGTYRLYARKFWKHGPYRATFDDGPPAEVTDQVALLDATGLRENVVANWTAAGSFTLAAGKHRLRIESTANDGPIAFDCFLLTDEPFKPRGVLKPDERQPSTRPGWFAWDPPGDVAGSAIDLSSLNPPIDGDAARITAGDGRLWRGGKPVRFWGVNVSADLIRQSDADLDAHAAFLARRGVNWVRIHSPVYQMEGNAGAVDARQVRNVQRAVAAFRRHGIYSTLSIYFPLWLRLDESKGWAGYKNAMPFGLLYFDEKFQALYRSWWEALLTTPDPTTGAKLADDPALLSLEMVNEDSLFFWTFKPYETIPAPQMEPLERRFAAWLDKRYGAARVALSQWPQRNVRGDDPANGRIGVGPLWQILDKRDSRDADTVAFLYDVQRDFYTRTDNYLRTDLGAKALITTSNWTTASDKYLTPIERATALVGDIVDRHGYFAGIHEGAHAASGLSPGDRYSDRSALRFDPNKPGDPPSVGTPFTDTTFNDRPSMLSEVDWSEPNRFRAEQPWIAAAMGAAQDLDAICFFNVGGGPGYEPAVGKFSVASPVAAGQFPAAAMVYRLGLLSESPESFDATLNLGDLLKLAGGSTGVDAKARLAGRAHIAIVDAPTSRPSVDVARYDDTANKTIRSANGQLRWDYGRGLLVIDAPRVQAVVGFLASAGPVTLGDVTIESPMPYGAVAVVPLDGEPIARSRRLLVQSMSEQQNSGWQAHGDEAGVRTIDSPGGPPLLVRDLAGTVTFRDGAARSAQAIDANGTADLASPATGPLRLPTSRPYVVLTPAGGPN